MIVRGKRPDAGYTVLSNACLRDARLSMRARGVLALLLSYPEDWRTDASGIAAQCSEGRDAIRTALAELRTVGYMVQEKRQNERGQWTTVTVVYDSPHDGDPATPAPVPPKDPEPDSPEPDDPAPGNPPPAPGNPTSVSQALYEGLRRSNGGGLDTQPPVGGPPVPKSPRCPRHQELHPDDRGPACLACRDARIAAERFTPANATPTPPPALLVLQSLPEPDQRAAKRGRAACRAALRQAARGEQVSAGAR